MPIYGENSAPVTEATTLTITAANTSQQVFPNTKRSYLEIQNNSDTDMWLKIGGTPSVGVGFKLAANGGSYSVESGFIPQGEVNLICSIAGKAFYAVQG